MIILTKYFEVIKIREKVKFLNNSELFSLNKQKSLILRYYEGLDQFNVRSKVA